MKKTVNKFWGVIPFITVAVCGVLVTVIEKVTDNTFRILPRNILICLGIMSIGILLLWINTRKKTKNHSIFSVILKIIFGILLGIVVLSGLFVMGFAYRPEHVVTKYGIKMVASVHSFLDEQVEYYEYKNWFFYGQKLGYEYYGNGGNDPLVQSPKPDPIRFTFYDLDGNVIESKGRNERVVKTLE